MTHLYSRGCEYALRALQVMVQEPQGCSTVGSLCRKAGIPEHFTRKMLQPLVRAGILNSSRGPGGGFTFTRSPEEIQLLEVVLAIESTPRFDLCILGMSKCDSDDPCPLHDIWAPIKEAAHSMLEEHSVADLATSSDLPAIPGAEVDGGHPCSVVVSENPVAPAEVRVEVTPQAS